MENPSLLTALAGAFLAGEQTADRVAERAARTLGFPWPWLKPLAARYLTLERPRRRDVVKLLRADPSLIRDRQKLRIVQWLHETPRMAARWKLPALETAGDLADWLRLLPADLDWFAGDKALGYRTPGPSPLNHYSYRTLTKSNGAIRLIEAPKTRLKRLQRRILTEVLDHIPSHPAAHGFVKGRSIQTFAAPHTVQRIVLRMDLRDFFPSFPRSRIQAFFQTAGYPEEVARLLGCLCTNATPHAVAPDPIFRRPHLPQGAPSSPALANICFYRMDRRLAGLAESAGAVYTRYADDVAFSGGDAFNRSADRFPIHVAAILSEEGFSVNHRKTRIMRQGVRQHLAGLVANQRLNVARPDFDILKAILTNCVREGPESQNRESHPAFRQHLEGRINFVRSVNPARGDRLRGMFDRIRW